MWEEVRASPVSIGTPRGVKYTMEKFSITTISRKEGHIFNLRKDRTCCKSLNTIWGIKGWKINSLFKEGIRLLWEIFISWKVHILEKVNKTCHATYTIQMSGPESRTV